MKTEKYSTEWCLGKDRNVEKNERFPKINEIWVQYTQNYGKQ